MNTGLDDITIIFLTVNKLPEKWVAYHREVLLKAIGNTQLITVSRLPVEMPGINLIQDGPINASNIYLQMLRAAKVVSTPYIAVVEDDSLYPREHFIWYRPKEDEFAYNMCRWAVFTWGTPTYWWKGRISNLTLIAPTKLTIEALEERFAKYPNGIPEHRSGELGKEKTEMRLGVTVRKHVQFWSWIPVINLNHIYAIDPIEVRKRKKMSPLQAYDIPYWGRASEIVSYFQ